MSPRSGGVQQQAAILLKNSPNNPFLSYYTTQVAFFHKLGWKKCAKMLINLYMYAILWYSYTWTRLSFMFNDDGNNTGMSFKFQGVKKDTDLSSQFSVQLFLPKVCCKTSLRSVALFLFSRQPCLKEMIKHHQQLEREALSKKQILHFVSPITIHF